MTKSYKTKKLQAILDLLPAYHCGNRIEGINKKLMSLMYTT